MRLIPLILFASLLATPVLGAGKNVTILCLDGARVEQDLTAANGYLEALLPTGMQAGSLRVKPVGKSIISRVAVVSAGSNLKEAKELARLRESRETLEDRLKALAVKEEIFIAAARSQSGKAPRRTKNNPEPLASIRQGTEFAVARLEDVYSSRRKAEKELKVVDDQLNAVRKSGNIGGSVAKVWVAGKDRRVKLSYLNIDLHWAPFYDFRLEGDGRVEITFHALLPTMEKGVRVVVAANSVADTVVTAFPRQTREDFDVVEKLNFQLAGEQYLPLPLSTLSFTFNNNTHQILPAGEAAAYWRGEFIGKTRFLGCKPGETRELNFGK